VYTAVVLAGVGVAGMLSVNAGSDAGSAFAAQTGPAAMATSPIQSMRPELGDAGDTSLRYAQATHLSASSAQPAHLSGSTAPKSLLAAASSSASGASPGPTSSTAGLTATGSPAGFTVIAAATSGLPTINPAPAASALTSALGAHAVKGPAASVSSAKPATQPATGSKRPGYRPISISGITAISGTTGSTGAHPGASHSGIPVLTHPSTPATPVKPVSPVKPIVPATPAAPVSIKTPSSYPAAQPVAVRTYPPIVQAIITAMKNHTHGRSH
jgi:hypothetical protein